MIPYANKQSPIKRSVPVYTEIEPQANPTHHRRNPIPPPLPVYSEIVLQPNPLMEKEIIAISENSNERHIPSLFPSSLSPRTIVHSSSEMGTASPSHSPTPPPPHMSVKYPTEVLHDIYSNYLISFNVFSIIFHTTLKKMFLVCMK